MFTGERGAVALLLGAVLLLAGAAGGCRKWNALVLGDDEIVMSCQESPATKSAVSAAPSRETKEPEWIWHDDDVDLLRCVRRDLADFEAEIDEREQGFNQRGLTITARSGEKFRIDGERYSTFCRRGDRLYLADYSCIASGCAIVAYDLSNGKVLWKKDLKGLGNVEHSKYRNRVVVAIESERIVVRSIEVYGAYVECLAQDDGRRLHHRLVEIPKGK